jgi:SNW domain-containing protein 1
VANLYAVCQHISSRKAETFVGSDNTQRKGCHILARIPYPCLVLLAVLISLLIRWQNEDSDDEDDVAQVKQKTKIGPPPQGHRAGWVPRALEDFGDGGAFPEIHAAQFPLDMGRKTDKKSSAVVALQMDSEGNIKYDAILNQDRTHRKIVQSTAKDLVAKKLSELDKEKPDEDEVLQKMQETQAALEKVINGKITAAKVARPEINQKKDAEYIRSVLEVACCNFSRGKKGMHDTLVFLSFLCHVIFCLLSKPWSSTPGLCFFFLFLRGLVLMAQFGLLCRYTPSQAGGNFNSGAKERIIKMHEMPVDPLEPPKFKHKKAPRGPPSPPVPVMHSPPKKISQKDMQDWKIPPCVSNWKNARGYTIPLDKRLAADGRGHSQVRSLMCTVDGA